MSAIDADLSEQEIARREDAQARMREILARRSRESAEARDARYAAFRAQWGPKAPTGTPFECTRDEARALAPELAKLTDLLRTRMGARVVGIALPVLDRATGEIGPQTARAGRWTTFADAELDAACEWEALSGMDRACLMYPQRRDGKQWGDP